MDWCIRNWRHISQTRLRNILRSEPLPATDSWGSFAATVNARAGQLPGATTERSTFRVTGRSTLRSLSEPSLVYLRMRGMFGVSARTEILRYFLFHQRFKVPANTLAGDTRYTKRNIAEACDVLVQADVLTAMTVGNRFYYSLTNPGALEGFAGLNPSDCARLECTLSRPGRDLEVGEAAEDRSAEALAVEVHQAVRAIDDALVDLGIDAPRQIRGVGILSEWDQWASDLMTDLASGTWPADESSSPVSEISTATARRSRNIAGHRASSPR